MRIKWKLYNEYKNTTRIRNGACQWKIWEGGSVKNETHLLAFKIRFSCMRSYVHFTCKFHDWSSAWHGATRARARFQLSENWVCALWRLYIQNPNVVHWIRENQLGTGHTLWWQMLIWLGAFGIILPLITMASSMYLRLIEADLRGIYSLYTGGMSIAEEITVESLKKKQLTSKDCPLNLFKWSDKFNLSLAIIFCVLLRRKSFISLAFIIFNRYKFMIFSRLSRQIFLSIINNIIIAWNIIN